VPIHPEALALVGVDEPVPLGRVEPEHRSFHDRSFQAATTLLAWGPFDPSTASNCTCAPSASALKPSPTIAEWWTNTSLPPWAGVMNPYPFASLNHFTVPVAIQNHSPGEGDRPAGGRVADAANASAWPSRVERWPRRVASLPTPLRCSGRTNVTPVPLRPARPVRPTRWM